MLLTPPNVNIVKVIDCLEYTLKQIQPPNFLSGPYVIDRAHDPRLLKQDKAQLYRQLGALIVIKSGDVKLARAPGNNGMHGTLGGVKRKAHRIELLVSVTISKAQDDAGLYLDSLLAAALYDIEWNCIYKTPGFIHTASKALNAANPAWGSAPSCINPLITNVVAYPPKHPVAHQTLTLDYQFDEYVRPFAQTNL